MQVSGAEPRSSARTATSLNYQTLSPALFVLFLKCLRKFQLLWFWVAEFWFWSLAVNLTNISLNRWSHVEPYHPTSRSSHGEPDHPLSTCSHAEPDHPTSTCSHVEPDQPTSTCSPFLSRQAISLMWLSQMPVRYQVSLIHLSRLPSHLTWMVLCSPNPNTWNNWILSIE